jgi:hypothetical protein
MKPSRFRRTLIGTLLIVVSGAGCQKKPADAQATNAAAKPALSTPEESFATVIENFRRGVEEIPIHLAVRDSSGGETLMTGRNRVTYELLPPQNEGEPFKAKITVTSDTQYSVRRAPELPVENSNQSEDAGADSASTDSSDVQILDPAVASVPSAGRSSTAGKSNGSVGKVVREENVLEREYELVHENGRWKLVTELDPATEESIKLAFDRALAAQS